MNLEQKDRVKARLKQLQEISKDPYYDQYLGQLLKDLESDKATPYQVQQEAERSYAKYRQRMSTMEQKLNQQNVQEVKPITQKKSFEVKIGAYVLSVIGAVFILTAYVILAFNFMSGLGQGISLYASAILVVVFSEIILGKKIPTFSHIITGIGMGGLYAANIANFLALKVINGMLAMLITMVIAVLSLFFGRKKDSTLIRIISITGCYICFYPIRGFSLNVLDFLIATIILLIINFTGVFFQNQRNQFALNIVHLSMHLLFSVIFLTIAGLAKVPIVYLILYLVSSFIFINLINLKQCKAGVKELFPVCAIASGICIFEIFFVCNIEIISNGFPEKALFTRLITQTLIIVAAMVTFLLWDKEDGRRWAQIYIIALTVLATCSFSPYNLELVIAALAILLVVKILSNKKEILVLDSIVTSWIALIGFALSFYNGWYCWAIVMALFLSIIRIRRLHLFWEILITFSIFFIWVSFLYNNIIEKYRWLEDWLYTIGALFFIFMFLLYNHLPWLKDKAQRLYNIISVFMIAMIHIATFFRMNALVSTVMMVIGVMVIMLMLRGKYGLTCPKKVLLLAGFLILCSYTSHYESPIIVSILLMIIAIICVGAGFKHKDRIERICGLVLAIFVCVKLVAYDFSEVETLYRMIVFLVVGVIALSISFIYICLERNEDRKIELSPEENLLQQEVSE